MNRAIRNSLSLALFISLGAACDPQVDETYPGEPLLELKGTIQLSEGYQPATELATVILWHDFAESDEVSFTEPTAVEGTFPADFTVSLYEPPPDAVFIDLEVLSTQQPSGKRIAMGYVAVVADGSASGPGSFLDTWENAAGIADTHLLVYAETAISASEASDLDGEVLVQHGLSQGYQLFRIEAADNSAYEACMAALDACIANCDTTCGQDVACADTCLTACDLDNAYSLCEQQYQDNDALVHVAVDDPLTITLGAEKPEPDWF
jgi:hypothetical protein